MTSARGAFTRSGGLWDRYQRDAHINSAPHNPDKELLLKLAELVWNKSGSFSWVDAEYPPSSLQYGAVRVHKFPWCLWNPLVSTDDCLILAVQYDIRLNSEWLTQLHEYADKPFFLRRSIVEHIVQNGGKA